MIFCSFLLKKIVTEGKVISISKRFFFIKFYLIFIFLYEL